MKKFLDKKLDEWILMIGFVAIILLVFSQVVFRYLIHIPIIGYFDELSRFIFMWLAWIGVAYAIRTKSHIRIEIFTEMIFRGKKHYVKYVEILIFLGFSIFLVVAGTLWVIEQQVSNFTSPMLSVPLWIVNLAIPISGALMSIRLIQELIELIKGRPKNEEPDTTPTI